MEVKIRKILDKFENYCWKKGLKCVDMSDDKEADQVTDQIIEEIKKVLLNELEMIKIADVTLGYNGLGTKMTTKEIHKIFKAIYTAQKEKLKKGEKND